jgi:hypothetical protein
MIKDHHDGALSRVSERRCEQLGCGREATEGISWWHDMCEFQEPPRSRVPAGEILCLSELLTHKAKQSMKKTLVFSGMLANPEVGDDITDSVV